MTSGVIASIHPWRRLFIDALLEVTSCGVGDISEGLGGDDIV